MVSFYKALTETPRTEVQDESSKKRKWEDEPFAKEFFKDQINLDEKRKSVFHTDPLLHSSFPSDKWSQYLTIQSGQIQLCNTKVEDSKRSHQIQPTSVPHMSLDLELNLTCESQRKKEDNDYNNYNYNYNYTNKKQNSGSPKSLTEHNNGSPSWLSTEGDYKEMVATVCMRCHMLVMLCKSSPACPNCKFMHPLDQNTSKFLKTSSTFFCST